MDTISRKALLDGIENEKSKNPDLADYYDIFANVVNNIPSAESKTQLDNDTCPRCGGFVGQEKDGIYCSNDDCSWGVEAKSPDVRYLLDRLSMASAENGRMRKKLYEIRRDYPVIFWNEGEK